MGTRLAVIEVDGVVSVQVALLRDTVRVSRPESTGVINIRETERVSVFSETVDVRICGQ